MMKIKMCLVMLCAMLFFSASSVAVSSAILCPTAANIIQNYAATSCNIIDFQNGEYEIFNASYPTSMVFVITLTPNNIPGAVMFLSGVTSPYTWHARVVPNNKNEVYCTYAPYNRKPNMPTSSGVIWMRQVS